MNRRLLLIGVLLFAGRPLLAQNCQTPNGATGTCSLNVASSLTIPTLLRLSIDDTTTSLPTPTRSDYTTGTVVSGGPVITIKTNSPWTLTVRAATTNWTGTGPVARINKPASDLAWGTSGGGPFTTMTTTNATIGSGTRGAANIRTMFYRVTWNWPTDTPGTYSLAVIYTVTSP